MNIIQITFQLKKDKCNAVIRTLYSENTCKNLKFIKMPDKFMLQLRVM